MSQQPEAWGQGQQQPAGWYGYTPPPRRRNPLPWILLGGGFATAIVVILVVVLTNGPDKSDPESVARAVVNAFDDNDFDEMMALTCEESKEHMDRTLGVFQGDESAGQQIDVAVELEEVLRDEPDSFTARIEVTYLKVPDTLQDSLEEGSSDKVRMVLDKENNQWCLSGFGG